MSARGNSSLVDCFFDRAVRLSSSRSRKPIATLRQSRVQSLAVLASVETVSQGAKFQEGKNPGMKKPWNEK
eukprot:2944958-Amphidinium_carterae.1